MDRVADRHIRYIRIILARDKHLPGRKRQIAALVEAFEKEKAWNGHVTLDVDPL